MSTIDTARALPDDTAARVAAAWASATSSTRRATITAAAISLALSAVAPAPATIRWALAATGVLFAVAALVDVREHKLPNPLLATAGLVTVGGAVGTLDRAVVTAAVIGMVIAGGLMLLVRIARGGVGMGDVKMAAVIGLSLGGVDLPAVPIAIAVAAAAGAGYGVLVRRTRLAFGPSLWFGWATALGATACGWLR